MQAEMTSYAAYDVPMGNLDGGIDVATFVQAIPALAHLAEATRRERISDGYRRLLEAILDDTWTSRED